MKDYTVRLRHNGVLPPDISVEEPTYKGKLPKDDELDTAESKPILYLTITAYRGASLEHLWDWVENYQSHFKEFIVIPQYIFPLENNEIKIEATMVNNK